MNGKSIYSNGTADFTGGSADVVGHSTVWSPLVAGDSMLAPDGKWYEVTPVDDTHLSLDRNYEGSTAAGQAYTIFKTSTDRDSVRSISQQLSQLTATYRQALNMTGDDRTVKLDKRDADDLAGLILQQNDADIVRAGIFGSNDFSIDYMKSGLWTKALGIDADDGTISILSQLVLNGIISPPAISSIKHNFNPTDFDKTSVMRLSVTADSHMTGLAQGKPGRVIALLNSGPNILFLDSQNANSTDVNRFKFDDTEVSIGPNASGLLIYDGVDQRWKLLSTAGNGGEKGWSPVIAIETDGARKVGKIVDWEGGAGVKPSVDHYLGPTGLVEAIEDAVNIRGPNVELQTSGGYLQWRSTDDVDWTNLIAVSGITGPQGDKGWSPKLVVENDGVRRVLKIISWQGGAGSPPASPKYVGDTDLVDTAAAGVDIRGPQGIQGIQGVGIQPNATGTLAQRAAHDGAAQDYIYLQTDVTPFLLFVKMSGTSGDWSTGTPVNGGDMLKSDNLDGLTDLDAARANLELGDLAIKNEADLVDPVAMAIVFGS